MKNTIIYAVFLFCSTVSFLEATNRSTNFNTEASSEPSGQETHTSSRVRSKQAMQNDQKKESSEKISSQEPQNLEFLDQEYPEDELNFLRTAFPQLAKRSEQVINENNYDEDLPTRFKNSEDPKLDFLEYVKSNLYLPIYDPQLYDNNAARAEAQKKYEVDRVQARLKGNPSADEIFILNQQLKPTRRILEDIVLAAEQIETTLLRYGHAPVLFVGRTPCFVQVVYEEICKQKQPETNLNDHIFHLSFSGTPDAIPLRSAASYQDEEHNILRNMLTSEKLEHYENYMTEKSLNNLGDKVYLVDMLGTGCSLNSFLRILRHYYENFLDRKMPDVHFLCLNLPYVSDVEPISGSYLFKHKTGHLNLKSLPKKGLRPLRIKTSPFQISEATIRVFLDSDWRQYFVTHGIEYPAQRWIPEFDAERNKGGKWHTEMYEWFRKEAQRILKIHALQKERS